jgi:hypothetical protein
LISAELANKCMSREGNDVGMTSGVIGVLDSALVASASQAAQSLLSFDYVRTVCKRVVAEFQVEVRLLMSVQRCLSTPGGTSQSCAPTSAACLTAQPIKERALPWTIAIDGAALRLGTT